MQERDHQIVQGNRWAKPIGIGVTVMAIIISIVAVGYSKTDIGEAARDYKKNHEAAEKLGLLFTSDEVAKLYDVPVEDNGAELLNPIVSIARKNKWDDPKKTTEAMFQEKWSDFETGLKAIEEASKRKHLIFKRNLSNPAAILYPQYADLKAWIRALTIMTQAAVAKGDTESAKRYLLAAAYLASAQDEEGTLIAVLVRIAGQVIVETELKDIVAKHGREAAWREVVKATLDRLEKPYNPLRSIQIEHWFAATSVEVLVKNPDSFYQDFGGTSSTPTVLKFSRFIPRFREANMSRIDAAYVGLASKMPSDSYDFESMKSAFGSIDQGPSGTGISYTLLNLVSPVFSQFGEAMAREVAYRNALAQAIALLEPGVDPHNGLPLKDRHIKDLDGKPLRLKQKNGGWIVYSIGSDKVDDGGVDMKDMKGDWVVHLPK